MNPRATRHASVTRRKVLVGAGGAVVGVALVSACGGASTPSGGSATSSRPGYGGPAEDSPKGSPAGATLTTVAEVPVGGAVSAKAGDGKPVIVAQPTKGDIVAFSAICTHKGCTVAPEGSQIACPCHGSTYDLTGKNTGGPAPRPLPGLEVKVVDGEVVEA